MKLWVSLLDLRTPASVRADRRALRRRLRKATCRIAALEHSLRTALRAEARRLTEVRIAIGKLTGAPRCCAVCAARLPEALPQFPGGFCCGSEAPPVTLERELAVLLLGDHHLDAAPATRVHSGCLFRTPAGCTLAPARRPSLCVGFLCNDLKRELCERGVLTEVVARCDELQLGVEQIGAALGL
jgi:hypothetical protein